MLFEFRFQEPYKLDKAKALYSMNADTLECKPFRKADSLDRFTNG